VPLAIMNSTRELAFIRNGSESIRDDSTVCFRARWNASF
jgi:hypothetical protein